MDYKYIYQLLERYWAGETSLSEERILEEFFSSEEVPEDLRQYRGWFGFCRAEGEVRPDEEAAARIDRRTARLEYPVRRFTLRRLVRAAYHVAACLALLFCVLTGAQRLFESEPKVEEIRYNYSSFEDAAVDPQVAYEQVYGSLRMLSTGLNDAGLQPDSVNYAGHNI